MDKEFCTYEQALALKELGFDEPCFGRWIEPTELFISAPADDEYCQKQHEFSWTALAPLYQQAFRWFREKHTLFHNIWNYTHGEPTDLIPNGFTFSIDEDWITIIGKNELGYFKKYYKTYEEAELACLDKLIVICKNK